MMIKITWANVGKRKRLLKGERKRGEKKASKWLSAQVLRERKNLGREKKYRCSG